MKILALFLVASLVLSSTGFADQAAPDTETQRPQAAETSQIAKIKTQVLKRGAGEKSKVRVTLGNRTMVKGFISKIDESSFDVNGSKTGQTTSISYADVQRIQGPGLSTGAKIAIGVAVGVAVVAVVLAIGLRHAGGPQGNFL